MEEVDEIVIHTLQQLGCEFGDDIKSLRHFTTELVVEGVVRCLQVITPGLELSHHVPPSMSARYRLGSSLASACIELGYTGEIGYQTFLYSNESDLRKVFIFLIEKLPKEGEKTLDEPLETVTLISRNVSQELYKLLNTPWLPPYCHSSKYMNNILFHACPIKIPVGNEHLSDTVKQKLSWYYNTQLPVISEQVTNTGHLASSVFETNALAVSEATEKEDEWNQRLNDQEVKSKRSVDIQKKIQEYLIQALHQSDLDKIVKGETFSSIGPLADVKRIKDSRFINSEKLQFTEEQEKTEPVYSVSKRPEDAEEMKIKMEEQISNLQSQVNKVTEEFEQMKLQKKQIEFSIKQSKELLSEEMKKINELEETYRVKECTVSLLPDADNNIQKLHALVESSTQRLVSLASQWEKHRVPLVEEYRQLKELSSQRLSESQRKLEEIKRLRERIKEIGDEARNKEEVHQQLIAAYEKLTKDVSRSSYTRRITEIVGNIKKQKAEIDKVLLDTRNVQKEINQLFGKLERTFTVTDELIFKDAKKDEAVRRAYKHLAALHENCSQLIHIVEETGTILREIRDLEDQIEQENQKKVADTLERITSDYRQMQQENATLMGHLKE